MPQGRRQAGQSARADAKPHQWSGAAHNLTLRIVLRSVARALELVLVLHISRRALGTSACFKGTMPEWVHRHGLFGQQSNDKIRRSPSSMAQRIPNACRQLHMTHHVDALSAEQASLLAACIQQQPHKPGSSEARLVLPSLHPYV